jgi:hypothetical protein
MKLHPKLEMMIHHNVNMFHMYDVSSSTYMISSINY